jgi:hypothetical protein
MEVLTKIGSKNYRVDLTANRIDFLDTRFYLSSNGNYYPSSTTILEAYPKGAAYFDWLKKNGEDSDSIRDEAGKRGSLVHQLTEKFDAGEEVCLFNNESGNIEYKMQEWSMFEKYVDFRRNHPCEIILSEQNIVSEQLGYAGTLDRVIKLRDKQLLLDIKTSAAIYNSYWLQLASYRQLLKQELQMDVDGVAVLWLNAKTRTTGNKKDSCQGIGWQLVTCFNEDEMDKYYRLFKATHALWLEENGSMLPKEFSYSLKHKL